MATILEELAKLDEKTFELMKTFKSYQESNEPVRLQFRDYLTQFHNLIKRASEEGNSDAYFKIEDRLDLYRTALRIYFRDVISLPFVPPPRISGC